jgi:protoheme IX farnesyltransferase
MRVETLECLVDQSAAVESGALGSVADRAAVIARAQRQATSDSVAGALVEATKPGITRLVTTTAMVGLAMSAAVRPWTIGQLLVAGVGVLVGTALSASGANAINQAMERRRDALMDRTRFRPIPSGRASASAVLAMGIALSIVGVAAIWMICGVVPAAVSLACVLSYVLVYTPLKPVTTLATFVGTIPGALPPLIGYSAAASVAAGSALAQPGPGAWGGWGSLVEPLGVSLVVLMCVWQVPHFLAIAWMYKDDYVRGGYLVLPTIDPNGSWTAATIGLWSVALLPATLLPAAVAPQLLGAPYLTIATLTGVGFIVLAARLLASRDRVSARRLFFASIIHLPIVLIAMVCESVLRVL